MKVHFRPVVAGGVDGEQSPGAREAARTASWEMTATHLAPSHARQALAEYARLVALDARVLTDVLLCVSEAVANVALHAYPDGSCEDTLEMDASIGEDLCIRVRDRGRGFAPAPEAPAAGPVASGLPIIARVARSFHVVGRAAGGMEIVMRFDLTPAAATRKLSAGRRAEAVLPLPLRHQLRHSRRSRRID